MLLILNVSPQVIHLANASTCNVSGSSHGTSSSSSSSSNTCACSVVASHGMVIISGNCKPSCPPGHDGTPSTDNDNKLLGIENEGVEQGLAGEVIASGSCFPNGEDEPSSMEHFEASTEAISNS
jgi:hypothetical protein